MLQVIQKETLDGFGAKMILQDRPQVLDSIPTEELPGIEKIVYDFMTLQPVKNAHIYYFRRNSAQLPRRCMRRDIAEYCFRNGPNLAAFDWRSGDTFSSSGWR